MPPLNVIFQVTQLGAAVYTKGTSVGFLPCVCSEVPAQVFPLTEILATYRTGVLEGKTPLLKPRRLIAYQFFRASARQALPHHLRHQEKQQ